ncbi:DUF5085 family protein [Leifsonia aquatica]|uniref:DUF5085 family protein n=1 Tax=Leifsonia aquatica TaxID=144185 RepID=UPI0037F3C8E6
METVSHDVAFADRLAYQNVVSFRAKFHYSGMAAQFDGFVSAVVAQGYDAKGPLFYTLNNVPLDEVIDIEMFLPVHQDTSSEVSGIRFHSYIEVAPLLRGVVEGDFENRTERVYAKLLATVEANGWEINSPFFHVLHRDPEPYVSILVGYRGSEEGGGAAETEVPE